MRELLSILHPLRTVGCVSGTAMGPARSGPHVRPQRLAHATQERNRSHKIFGLLPEASYRSLPECCDAARRSHTVAQAIKPAKPRIISAFLFSGRFFPIRNH